MAELADGKAMPELEKKKEQSLSFYQLFSFADKYDWVLMISGSLGAIIHGSSMPVFFLLFGKMVNGFGKNQMDLHNMTREVSKYALYFVYLGLVVCFSSYAEIACWMYTGERQVGALRKKYLEAVLKQDVGFFDTDARTGDIVFSVSTDTLLVQDAISEKYWTSVALKRENGSFEALLGAINAGPCTNSIHANFSRTLAGLS